jgi:hypothetical protein
MLEVDAISLDAVLLRGLLPDLRLRAGTTLPARVLERTEHHGLLVLAGTPVVAELPEEVAAGQRLRLAVAEVTAERVLLRVVGDPAAPGAPPPPGGSAPTAGGPAVPPPAIGLPLPGLPAAHVTVAERDEDRPGREEHEGEGGVSSVVLHYDSPRLGRIGLRLTLAAGQVSAAISAPPGRAHELAGERAGELRTALARALDRPADVHVGARYDRVDRRA